MTKRLFLFPDNIRDILIKRYRIRHRNWLDDASVWPLNLPLGCPSEDQARQQPDVVRAWVNAWQSWQGVGELIWCERRWRSLGMQRLPKQLLLRTPQAVAGWVGKGAHWQQANLNYQRLVARWPVLAARLPDYFDMLANYSNESMKRLENLLGWLEQNPQSNLYPRQLPIAGLDSKWLEQRKMLIADLIATLQGHATQPMDFFQRCGLKSLPSTIRLKILDPSLRQTLQGLSDIVAPVQEIALLDLPISQVYIVENIQTGLSFADLPNAVVFMGLGYGVDILAHIPWLLRAKCVYWGDVDTHGFAILNRARACVPHLQSVLMDEKTFLNYQSLWGTENKQHAADNLPLLTAREQALYQGLKLQRWGVNLRLEQERIEWEDAWNVLCTGSASR